MTNKYYAKVTEVDGFRFHSRKEADYYVYLRAMRTSGRIKYFLMQAPLHLPGNIRYVVDFIEVWANGEIKFTDVKGFRTAIYRLKKKQVEALYPITIQEV